MTKSMFQRSSRDFLTGTSSAYPKGKSEKSLFGNIRKVFNRVALKERFVLGND